MSHKKENCLTIEITFCILISRKYSDDISLHIDIQSTVTENVLPRAKRVQGSQVLTLCSHYCVYNTHYCSHFDDVMDSYPQFGLHSTQSVDNTWKWWVTQDGILTRDPVIRVMHAELRFHPYWGVENDLYGQVRWCQNEIRHKVKKTRYYTEVFRVPSLKIL